MERAVVARPALPPVTEHPIDGAVVAAVRSVDRTVGHSVTQTVQLTVVGGPLELVTTAARVALERAPGGSGRDWVGTLDPVRVVDARGTHEGWSVHWSATGVEVDGEPSTGGQVRVEAAEPVVVAGVPDGIASGHGGHRLFGASRGAGGGTYEAGGTVTLRLPRSIDATSVVVELAFRLG